MTCHVCAKPSCLDECSFKTLPPREENMALRTFLLYYGSNTNPTIEGLRFHLKFSGFDKCWPHYLDEEVGYITKECAQNWIRYILAEEQPSADMVLVPKEVANAAILWTYCPKEGSYQEGPSVEDTCESLGSAVESWLGVSAPDVWSSVEDIETLLKRKLYGK